MHQELSNQKIHSLHVICLIVIAWKCSKNISEFAVPWLSWLEKLILGECSSKISFYLKSWLLFWFEFLQTFVVLFAFLVFIEYYLGYFNLFIYFLLSPYLQGNNISCKPHDSVLTSKAVGRILVAITLNMMLHFLELHYHLIRTVARGLGIFGDSRSYNQWHCIVIITFDLRWMTSVFGNSQGPSSI